MTQDDARKILGLGLDEDPQPYYAEFDKARQRIADMIGAAPNPALAKRFQLGLDEFDQALSVIRRDFSRVLQEPIDLKPEVIPTPPPTQVLGVVKPPKSPLADTEDQELESPPSRALSFAAWFFIIFVGAMGGAWFYVKNEEFNNSQRLIRIAFLERNGSILVENRRWQDAADVFAEIESLSPGSEISQRGRRSIEAGMTEEQTQYVGYWIGQATAELEAVRLDEATNAIQQVLKRFPQDAEALALAEQVSAARETFSKDAALGELRKALEARDWELAKNLATRFLKSDPTNQDANQFLTEATGNLQKVRLDQVKAKELLALAMARDSGQFDQQALDWLREAKSLSPDDPEINRLFEKLSSYVRTIHVPGDFATPQEAINSAHDRDRIVIEGTTWNGPLVINVALELQGSGPGMTIIQCAPGEGSPITIGPDAQGAQISGIGFRHSAFAIGDDRYSSALVRGGNVNFTDCEFSEASGHGLAVIEGGSANVTRSRCSGNGWNGMVAVGQGSKLKATDCETLNNFENGFEAWDGGALELTKNRCEGNSRNGIHADSQEATLSVVGNRLIGNREFGIVIGSAGAGRISENLAKGNLLGGIVLRAAARNLEVTANETTANEGPGLVLERGLAEGRYATNIGSKNAGAALIANAELTSPAPATDDAEAVPRATIVIEPATGNPD